MPEQIAEKTKSERSEIIRKLADETKYNYRKSFIGKTQQVLVEKINKNGFATGYGEHYIPVVIKAEGLTKNAFYEVQITGIEAGEEPVLSGNLTKEKD